MNPIEATPLQLPGRGLTVKGNAQYLPGEYDEMSNLEVTPSGTIGNRKGFNFAVNKDGSNSPTVGRGRFFGTYGPWPIYSGLEIVYQNPAYPGPEYDLPTVSGQPYAEEPDIAPEFPEFTSGDTETLGGGLEAVWYYNDAIYYLYSTVRSDDDIGSLRAFYVVREAHYYDLNIPAPLGSENVPGSPYTSHLVHAQTSTDSGYASANSFGVFNLWANVGVKGHMIFRERAWFATVDTVFCSKATDPSSWIPPDGFFVKFPKQEIKQILGLNDLVYVFQDTSIHVIQYGTDPNVDGEVTIISKELGAEAAIAVGDIVYFIKGESLYAISGTNIQKITDLQLGIQPLPNEQNRSYSLALNAFDNVLYFFPRTVVAGDGFGHDWLGNGTYEPHNENTRIFRFDLETQFFSSFDVQESLEVNERFHGAYPVDMVAVTSESWDNQGALYFVFNTQYDRFSPAATIDAAVIGYIDVNQVFTDAIPGDQRVGEAKPDRLIVSPSFDMRVKQWSPDTTPYYMRKYRSIVLDIEVDVLQSVEYTYILNPDYEGLGNVNEEPVPQYIIDETIVTDIFSKLQCSFGQWAGPVINLRDRNDNALAGYRYPLMQRSKTMDIRLFRDAFESVERTERSFELRDVQVLWTLTQRGPHHNTDDES
jgi:hypothetical protein